MARHKFWGNHRWIAKNVGAKQNAKRKRLESTLCSNPHSISIQACREQVFAHHSICEEPAPRWHPGTRRAGGCSPGRTLLLGGNIQSSPARSGHKTNSEENSMRAQGG